MSIKTVNALSHYTDWTVGHVHSGALGWVAMISIGSIYYLLPRLFGKTEMYSTKLITTHFWIATIGVVLYIASMWICRCDAGPDVACHQPGRHADLLLRRIRQGQLPVLDHSLLGGLLFLTGMLIMFYNMFKTMAGGKAYDAPVLAPAGAHA
jgi:cytochrome c oxidase cbb3-type subunit 1